MLAIAVLASFLAVMPALAGAVDPGASGVETVAAIRKSDSLFAMLRYKDALAVLEAENRQRPSDPRVLWRLASQLINAGDVADDDAKDAYYVKSVAYAEKAVALDPRCADAHAYLAAALGSHAMFVGGKEKVQLSNRIQAELDRALALDPKNQVAHTIYGTWHRSVTDVSWIERKLANIFLGGLPDGSFEESIRHFRAAITVAPSVLRHRYELGQTYIAMDRPDLAVLTYRDALKCPLTWSTDPLRKVEMRAYIAKQKG
jgi:tetratricopeptide (TPR) repeat protein